MKASLTVLLGSLSFFSLSCQEEQKRAKKSPPEKIETKEESKSDRKSLLNVPAGAVITDLTLPYHNKEGRKVSLLTIDELTVNEDEEGIDDAPLLTGETLKLWLFDRDGTIRSTALIPEATYQLETEILEADGQIVMVGAQNQFAAKSTGGIISLATGQALLLGPATTRFTALKKKKD